MGAGARFLFVGTDLAIYGLFIPPSSNHCKTGVECSRSGKLTRDPNLIDRDSESPVETGPKTSRPTKVRTGTNVRISAALSHRSAGFVFFSFGSRKFRSRDAENSIRWRISWRNIHRCPNEAFSSSVRSPYSSRFVSVCLFRLFCRPGFRGFTGAGGDGICTGWDGDAAAGGEYLHSGSSAVLSAHGRHQPTGASGRGTAAAGSKHFSARV